MDFIQFPKSYRYKYALMVVWMFSAGWKFSLQIDFCHWYGCPGSEVKNLYAVQETWVWSLGWEDPWRREWQTSPEFFPGKSHGQRSLVGYSPWGCKSRHDLVTKPPSLIWLVQFSTVTQSCPTLCDPMNHSTPVVSKREVSLLGEYCCFSLAKGKRILWKGY